MVKASKSKSRVSLLSVAFIFPFVMSPQFKNGFFERASAGCTTTYSNDGKNTLIDCPRDSSSDDGGGAMGLGLATFGAVLALANAPTSAVAGMVAVGSGLMPSNGGSTHGSGIAEIECKDMVQILSNADINISALLLHQIEIYQNVANGEEPPPAFRFPVPENAPVLNSVDAIPPIRVVGGCDDDLA